MSDPQRRDLWAAAGTVSLGALATALPAFGGDPSFMNNVPDPTLAGDDLPTFTFALEKSRGNVIGNSYGKEATVAQLPPRGHGHMLQCLGDRPCRFILIFDNGYFSEFGTFSVTDWIGHTPPDMSQTARSIHVQSARTSIWLAQPIGVKRMGQKYADADEDEECRHDFGHSLPPCVGMPERAVLRNAR